VTETTLPALDGDDGLAGLDDAEVKGRLETESESVVNVRLPLRRVNTSGLVVLQKGNKRGKGMGIIQGDVVEEQGRYDKAKKRRQVSQDSETHI
jgi:hypothetical protein